MGKENLNISILHKEAEFYSYQITVTLPKSHSLSPFLYPSLILTLYPSHSLPLYPSLSLSHILSLSIPHSLPLWITLFHMVQQTLLPKTLN